MKVDDLFLGKSSKLLHLRFHIFKSFPLTKSIFSPACSTTTETTVIFTDIVDEKGADSSPVVGGGDGSVPLLARGVPDLSFDGFPVNLNRPGSKLHSDSGLGLQIKLVPCKS